MAVSHDFIITARHMLSHFNMIADSLSLFSFSGLLESLPQCQHSLHTCPSSQRASSLLEDSQMYNYLESARFYMRKGLAASTLKSYDFAWITFGSFCVSLNIPLKPVLIKTICTFFDYCIDVRHLKPQYIHSLLAGIQLLQTSQVAKTHFREVLKPPSHSSLCQQTCLSCKTSDSRGFGETSDS